MKNRIASALTLAVLMTANLLNTPFVVYAGNKTPQPFAQSTNAGNLELPPFAARLLDELASNLNLTDAQKAEIKRIIIAERPAFEPLVATLLAQAEELRAATRSGQFNEAQVRAIVARQSTVIADLYVVYQRLLSKIYNVLTPEQVARLRELREQSSARGGEGVASVPSSSTVNISPESILDRIATELNLTSIQKLRIMLILAAEYPRIESTLRSLTENQQQQFQSFLQNPRFDEAQARAFATVQAQLIGELLVAKERIQKSLYDVLTTEQRAKLEALLDELQLRLKMVATFPVIDDARGFVRQQYVDFLNREPDTAGFNFWTKQITDCNGDLTCVDRMRVNTSAAFFLSIEFQGTGFLVHRFYKATRGTAPRYDEFQIDSRSISRGVVVNQQGWEQLLENNKAAFAEAWVTRPAFKAVYDAKTNSEYVDALIANTGVTFSASDRAKLIDNLTAARETRASVLRKIAESEQFTQREFNPAFVLMQYFGYLRRNPDDAPDGDMRGFNFWLKELNGEGSGTRNNYPNMVRAFVISGEYRGRFGAN
ncbi:MAG: Spy/CpxP family protein refolding chaperone [Pyrinomonadaceae bacterium]|nr:Spy/CpxP family protein refolding chaperone [Pyrinomonadaceae bacterium]